MSRIFRDWLRVRRGNHLSPYLTFRLARSWSDCSLSHCLEKAANLPESSTIGCSGLQKPDT